MSFLDLHFVTHDCKATSRQIPGQLLNEMRLIRIAEFESNGSKFAIVDCSERLSASSNRECAHIFLKVHQPVFKIYAATAALIS